MGDRLSSKTTSFFSSFGIFVLFVLIFISTYAFYARSVLLVIQDRFNSRENEFMVSMAEDIQRSLSEHYQEAVEDSYYLYRIGNTKRVRITLFNRNETVLRDSRGLLKPGDKLEPDLGVPADGRVWQGEKFFLIKKENMKEWNILYDLFQGPGDADLTGIRLIRESEAALPEGFNSYLFFLKFLGAAAFLAFGMATFRGIRRQWKESMAFPGENIQGENPVMNTFQGLIQELKQKESELEKLKSLAETRAVRSENFQETILRSIHSGVLTFDKNKMITSYNDSAEKVFGISRASAVGKSCGAVFGEESMILKLLDRIHKEERPVSRAEFEMNRGKSQERIWIGVSASFLLDDRSEFIGTVFIFNDITEIRMLQEQVELQKRLSVLGEMSAGIAHEFRNFMGTILGYARLIGKKKEEDAAVKPMVDAVIAELQAMDHLIRQLLSFGKQAPVNRTRILLQPFFAKMLAQAVPNAGTTPSIRPVLDISDATLSITSDEIMIRQAFLNLIQNAIEAMPMGGALTVSARPFPAEKIKAVLIEIKDTGTGISSDNLDKIFNPFFTLKEKGTGLGLAIVHKIILQNKGRIQVESQQGKGTVFRIYLLSE
ncbi:MAG TPA: ATP-binding protein [Nitrospiria bacterium]|nr:ATP-binding protein [Nitrospiria bacterium]